MARWALRVLVLAVAAGAVWWSYRYSQARQHWQQAQTALKEENAESAREHLVECLRWWGKRGDVRLLAAKAARLTGNLDEAEEHLTFCESLPRRAVPGDALRRERALLQVQQGDLSGYLATVAPNGVSDPTLPPDVLEAAAHGFDAVSDDAVALLCLRQLFSSQPNHWRGRYLAGDILVRTSRAEEALPELEQAAAAAPHAIAPRRRLAEALIELGHTREAARHIEALRQRYPDDAGVMFLRARVLVYRGQTNDARGVLEQVLGKEPGHVAALVERGRLEYRSGDARKAQEWFRLAVAREPTNTEALQGLTHCHDSLGEAEEARRCRAEVARILRESGEATRLFGEISQVRGSTPTPPDVGKLLELADRCERLNMLGKATSLRLQAIMLEPQLRTRLALAEYYERSGRSHLAARQRALSNP